MSYRSDTHALPKVPVGRTVSVITPCFNPGPSLTHCLNSVASQSYSEIEHIVVDGGSTDGTLDLLRDRSGIRWVSEPDEGQAQAINKGFKMASGEVVGWLNADDMLKTHSVEAVLKHMSETGADCVYGSVRVVEGGKQRTWVPPDDVSTHLLGMGRGGVIPQPGSLFKSEALGSVGGLDESFHLAMDFDLWLAFLGKGLKFARVDTILAEFHIHPGSKTGRLGLAPFFLEEARSLQKHGYQRAASLALGRAAAQSVLDSGDSSTARLEREIDRVLQGSGTIVENPSLVRAGAFTEIAMVEMARGWSGLRHLFRVTPWVTIETRRRIIHAFNERMRKVFNKGHWIKQDESEERLRQGNE